MRTLVWDAGDVSDVFASHFRDVTYQFMEMPRDQRGFMYMDKVLKNDRAVGISSSRGYSYYFKKMLSLCTIDVEYSEPGTEVTVVWGDPGSPQKHIKATVAPAPYKKDNRRADLQSLRAVPPHIIQTASPRWHESQRPSTTCPAREIKAQEMTKELVELSRATPANPLPGWGPSEYTNWMDEQMSWKRTCYIGDWSFLPALKVEGPDALKLFSDFTVNTFERFDIGQAKHAIQCNQNGKVISEGISAQVGRG